MEGNLSDIEDFVHDDFNFETNTIFIEIANEETSDADSSDEDKEISINKSQNSFPLIERSSSPDQALYQSLTCTSTESNPRRIWKPAHFVDKLHDYKPLPTKPVRHPIEYFRQYIDNAFLEKMAHCTNSYYLRTMKHELNCTTSDIAKVLAIQIIMGCIPYPQVPMYWRTGTRLEIISNLMPRDRFLNLRNALHLVDYNSPPSYEVGNPLWKVQPMIDQIKRACNELERVPGFYCIDEHVIPFISRFKSKYVVKNKLRPVGIRNFVLTTQDGVVVDFDIHKSSKAKSDDTNLGLGPSVVLKLAKKIPPGSCVYQDKYFTTVPLIEEMDKLNLHCTGTISLNRIPGRDTINFKTDAEMKLGESQQFVCEHTTIVKWKYNKSVLLASNCTGSDTKTNEERLDKTYRGSVNTISVPKIVKNYNQHMKGVEVLNQQIENYRSLIKSKKWTLKVMIHFLDLALVNSWRQYKNDCISNNCCKDMMSLLDFRLDVASALSCVPDKARTEIEDDDPLSSLVSPHREGRFYRPANEPTAIKRYDGYEHFPTSDDIRAPRSCRLATCKSRSKIRCMKCDVYLCLSRDKNCFKTYHTQ